MIVPARVRLPFSYAAGAAGSRFLAALRDHGAILASPCPCCGRALVPARSFCPRCFEATEPDWVEVGPTGELVAVTRVPAAAGRHRERPGAFCLVRLDGADTALAHLLLEPAEPGERVRAVLADERRGSILDVSGFEREEGGR